MSIGPRDRVVERLLQTGAAPAEPSAECLDAETLAAWVDGGLDTDSTARAEAHVSNCAYCQTVVASMVHVADAIGASSLDQPSERPWWQLNIRWLVPILGAATAGLLWVVVPSQSPGDAPSEARIRNEVVSRAPEPSAAVNAVQPPAEGRRSDVPTTTSPTNAAKPAAPPARPAPAQPALQKEVDRQERDQTSSLAKAEKPAALEERAAPAERREAAPLATPVAPAAPAAAGVLGAADATRNRAAFAEAAPVIASGVAGVLWRVRDESIVERSSDGGATWAATEGSPGRGVLAGASPSPDVCWLVGRDGLVQVTTDARTWRRAAAPVVEDLVRVEPTDARRARVQTASGVSYETDDGGATWRRSP